MAEAPQAAPGGCAMDANWLDQRFADIAARIEQSMARMRPENAMLSLGRRFDALETQLNSVLGHVATRADLDELRAAEAQIDEIGNQLSQFRRQLARLDVIDAHLGTLTSQLSDERLTRLFNDGVQVTSDAGRLDAIDAQLRMIAVQLSDERLSGLVSRSSARDVDYEDLANSAAQRAAANFVESNIHNVQARDIGEMRGMLENLINERRHNDENNASMLETMQQAIIRVLDRIDALEITQQEAAGRPLWHGACSGFGDGSSGARDDGRPRAADGAGLRRDAAGRGSFRFPAVGARRASRAPTCTLTSSTRRPTSPRRVCPSTPRRASTSMPPSRARAMPRLTLSTSRRRRSALWKCCATTSSPMRTAPSSKRRASPTTPASIATCAPASSR